MQYCVEESRRGRISSSHWRSQPNALQPEDHPVHDWYRFVLAFPPHLVRRYLNEFALTKREQVLDPFCGTGTTVIECKKNGIASVGVEANRMAYFACETKINWDINVENLWQRANKIAARVEKTLGDSGFPEETLPLFRSQYPDKPQAQLQSLGEEQESLLIDGSISPIPLHKTLVLLDTIKKSEGFNAHELLALAKTLVFQASNLKFSPEVGVGKKKQDVLVTPYWLEAVESICQDLAELSHRKEVNARVYHGDSRELPTDVGKKSIDLVITSPPYPNEKDYGRATRLESVILGFIKNKRDITSLRHNLLRSNSRSVYKSIHDGDCLSPTSSVEALAQEIEQRRLELGKTSGFERQYAKAIRLYFLDMARHLAQMRTHLKPGAHLVYVVGDQASYFRVLVRTGHLLAEIAESLGYKFVRIDLFRTRTATATGKELREEAVILRWDGRCAG